MLREVPKCRITSYFSRFSQTITRRSKYLARSVFVPKFIKDMHLTWQNGVQIKVRGSYNRQV